MSSPAFIRKQLIKNYQNAYMRANGTEIDVVYCGSGWYELRPKAISHMPGIKGDKMRIKELINATHILNGRADKKQQEAMSVVVKSHAELLPIIFDRDTSEADSFREDLKNLREFTEGCRPSMHEPDEAIGEVKVQLAGNHLDNAGGSGEYALVMTREDGKELTIRVTDLIALARTAVIIER